MSYDKGFSISLHVFPNTIVVHASFLFVQYSSFLVKASFLTGARVLNAQIANAWAANFHSTNLYHELIDCLKVRLIKPDILGRSQLCLVGRLTNSCLSMQSLLCQYFIFHIQRANGQSQKPKREIQLIDNSIPEGLNTL